MSKDGASKEGPKFTGLSKYFNGETIAGRANVSTIFINNFLG